MAAALKLDGDGYVVGTWSGAGAVPAGHVAVSDAVAAAYAGSPKRWPGSDAPRWHYDAVAEVLSEAPDPRWSGVWSQAEYALQVGDPEPTVQLQLFRPDGTPFAGTAIREVRLSSGHRIALDVRAGVASVVIGTAAATDYEITHGWALGEQSIPLRFDVPLRVRVVDVKLYPI